MCGISGYLSIVGTISLDVLRAMTSIVSHRGPDDEGYILVNASSIKQYCGNDSPESIKKKLPLLRNTERNSKYFLGFGHRRLSIIDLSDCAHQPFQWNELCITYNGEIYNYIEIRDELIKVGYSFVSNSDVEVLLKAYDYWREDCVNHFNGMWSFMIWNNIDRTLFCSRDRFGIKPFYYYQDKSRLLFSSEIKQILEDCTIERKVNESQINTFLAYGLYSSKEETFFQNIFSLPASHNMTIKFDPLKGTFIKKVYQYWSLNKNPSSTSIDDAAKSIGGKLARSVQLRLRSDVEVGSCLSGGLDSSSIVTLACRELNRTNKDFSKFNTFTVSYKNETKFDESHYSHIIASFNKCRENLIYPDANYVKNNLNRCFWHQDEPTGTILSVIQYIVMEEAAKVNTKVLLDGQGGDEVFLGYERYYVNSIFDFLKERQIFKAIKQVRNCSLNSRLSFVEVILYLLYFSLPQLRRTVLIIKNIKYIKFNCFNNKSYKKIKRFMSLRSTYELHCDELFETQLPRLLKWEDRSSMAFSIEARVPFLDFNLVQEAVSIPISTKTYHGWTKYPVRLFMKDKMPAEIVYRKNKMGFPGPEELWMNQLNDWFLETLIPNAKSSKYFHMKEIKKLFIKRENWRLRSLFVSVEIWMRTFNVS